MGQDKGIIVTVVIPDQTGPGAPVGRFQVAAVQKGQIFDRDIPQGMQFRYGFQDIGPFQGGFQPVITHGTGNGAARGQKEYFFMDFAFSLS